MIRIDSLERRILFATFVVEGTPSDDIIFIVVQKQVITVTVNGTPFQAFDPAIDVIDVRGLGGNDQITLVQTGDNDVIISGDHPDGSGDGDDVINITNGNLDNAAAPVTVIAGGGDDLVRLNDQNNMFSDAFTITESVADRVFFGGLSYGTDLERLVLHASRGSSQITVESTSAQTRVSIDSGTGTDEINLNQTHPDSPVTILPAPGDDTINVSSTGVGPAGALFEQTQRIGALTIGGGGRATVQSGSGAVITSGSLTLTADAQFDLADNAAIVDYPGVSHLPLIEAYLSAGYNGGAWNGSGIISSAAAISGVTAVGYAEATDLFDVFPATFAGQSVDDTAILLKHTFYGDADLNGNVNLADFNRLAANFGGSPRRWSHGDFDFNQLVNLADFNGLASNFGTSTASAMRLPSDDSYRDETNLEDLI